MDIFESLENLNVSEECFDSILSIVEAKLADRMNVEQLKGIVDKVIPQREKVYSENKEKYGKYDQKTYNSKYRLNYAKFLKRGLNDAFRRKTKLPISQAKKQAKNETFYSKDPGSHAVASIGNETKNNLALGY